jgi:S1-C subfamily serine protease
VWATAPEGRATSYPALGVVLARGGGPGDGARVERLAHGARPPRGLELRVGDVIVEADGRRIGDAFALRWLLEEKEWGDAIALRVRRGASLLELRGRL